MRRMLAVGSWLTGLCGAAAVLLLAGRGALAGPDLAQPSTWATWAVGRDPIDAAVAVLRTALLTVTAYLLLVTVLGLVARAVSLPRLVAGLDLAGGPLVRRVLTGAAGAGLALSTLTPAVASAQTAVPPATPVMRLLDEPTTTTVIAPAPAPVAPPAAPPEHAEYLVRPGDSFWAIADRHVAQTLGRTPTDREVASYWRRLISANRDRLVVADEPDLIHPGQTFLLP